MLKKEGLVFSGCFEALIRMRWLSHDGHAKVYYYKENTSLYTSKCDYNGDKIYWRFVLRSNNYILTTWYCIVDPTLSCWIFLARVCHIIGVDWHEVKAVWSPTMGYIHNGFNTSLPQSFW